MTIWPPQRIALYREELSSEPRAIAALDEIERLQARVKELSERAKWWERQAATHASTSQRREQLLRDALPWVEVQDDRPSSSRAKIAARIRAEIGDAR